MIRGGKIDMAILGAMEVSETGRPRQLDDPRQAGEGHGRRDGPRRRRQARRRGHGPRLQGRRVEAAQGCTLPLTGKGVVDRIITNLGVFDVVEGGLTLVELADGVTEAEVRAATEAKLV